MKLHVIADALRPPPGAHAGTSADDAVVDPAGDPVDGPVDGPVAALRLDGAASLAVVLRRLAAASPSARFAAAVLYALESAAVRDDAIADARRRHPVAAARGAFVGARIYLEPPVAFIGRDARLLPAHFIEILDRVGRDEGARALQGRAPLAPFDAILRGVRLATTATNAEVAVAFADLSLRGEMSRTAFRAYLRVFRDVFGPAAVRELAEAAGDHRLADEAAVEASASADRAPGDVDRLVDFVRSNIDTAGRAPTAEALAAEAAYYGVSGAAEGGR